MSSSPPKRSFAPGDTVGDKYLLEETLGEGGMGAVFLASHLDTRERVALKVSHAHSAAHLISLRAEITALLDIDHPAVVRVVDHGLDEIVPWFAMEHIVGVSLRDRLGETFPTERVDTTALFTTLQGEPAFDLTLPHVTTPMSAPAVRAPAPEERNELLIHVAAICRGLAHVHAGGLVHRDLKPENIVVRRTGEPVLVDFGIATPASGAVRERLSESSGAAGTLPYMAPELLMGVSTDNRTDLYAVGCLLFELVTGRPPFLGPPSAVALGHVHGPVPSLEAHDVSPQLDALIRRLLSKQPAARPAYADDVARELEGILGLPPSEAEKTAVQIHRAPFVGRREILTEAAERLGRVLDDSSEVVAVVGKRGSGRTRFLQELLSPYHANPNVDVFVARGGANESTGPFATILSRVVDRCRERGPEHTRQVLGEEAAILKRFLPSLASLAPSDAPVPEPLPKSLEVARTTKAWMTILTRLAPDRKHVIAVDDANAEMFPYLVHASRLLEDSHRAFAIIAAFDAENAQLVDELDELNESADSVKTVHLQPLAPAESVSVASAMLANAALPEVIGNFIAEQSAGWPAAIGEIVRRGIETRLIEREHGTWRIDESLDNWRARAGEQAAHATLLRDLDAAALDTARVLALFGLEIPWPVVEALARTRGPQTLATLLRVQLVSRGEQTLSFNAAGVRDAILEQMTEGDHSGTSRALAKALEASELAESERPRIARLYEDAADLEEAARNYAIAIELAEKDHRTNDRIGLCERYLALELATPARHDFVFRSFITGLLRIGAYVRIIEMREEVLKVARGTNNPTVSGTLLITLGVAGVIGGRPEFEEYARKARAKIGQISDTLAISNILLSSGSVEMRKGEFDRALEYGEAARKILENSPHAHLTAAVDVNRGGLLIRLCRFDEARTVWESLRDILAHGRRPDFEAYVHLHLADIYGAFDGEPVRALAEVEKSIEISRNLHERSTEGYALLLKASLLTDVGKVNEALDTIRVARAMLDVTGDTVGIARSAVMEARALTELDRVEEAIAVVEAPVDEGIRSADKVKVLLAAARLRRTTGEYRRAEDHLIDAARLAEKGEMELEVRVGLQVEQALLSLALDEPPVIDMANLVSIDDSNLRLRSRRLRAELIRAKSAWEAGETLRHGAVPTE